MRTRIGTATYEGGDTVEAAARLLLRAGAASVDVVVFARVATVLDGNA